MSEPTTERQTTRMGPRPRPAVVRVLSRIEIRDTGYDTPCWIFTGSTSQRGYGKVGSRRDGRNVFELAHRVVWSAANGPIPDGLHLDHLCSTRGCVCPTHAAPVSPFENNRRQQLRRLGRSIEVPEIQ